MRPAAGIAAPDRAGAPASSLCRYAAKDATLCDMSRIQPRELQLSDDRGRKYLTSGERERFLAAAARAEPKDQTFALALAHTGARVSEILGVRLTDVDLDLLAIRIRTLKRRGEHWREVPIPGHLVRALELVHALRTTRAKTADQRLWSWSRATAHRKIVRIMAEAGIEGPQACPKGLRHGFGIAAVSAGVPLPTIAAVLGHADLATTAIYTTATGVEARAFVARMWRREAESCDFGG